jgi:Pre-mRNA 3'-end-processing endonuclease polyadenylation factor C-term
MAPEDLPTYTPLTTQQIAQRLLVPFGQPLAAAKQLLFGLFGKDEVAEEFEDDVRVSEGKKEHGDSAAEAGGAKVKVESGASDGVIALRVCDDLRISIHDTNEDTLVLEWNADPVADMVADSVIAVLSGSLLE